MTFGIDKENQIQFVNRLYQVFKINNLIDPEFPDIQCTYVSSSSEKQKALILLRLEPFRTRNFTKTKVVLMRSKFWYKNS